MMTAKGKSIGRQISLSITVASLCSTVLSISGFYLFYYLLEVFYPRWYDEPRSEERRGGKECRSLCDWSSDVCSSDLSITVASLCSTVLSISGFYLFYYLLEVFYPRWYDEP